MPIIFEVEIFPLLGALDRAMAQARSQGAQAHAVYIGPWNVPAPVVVVVVGAAVLEAAKAAVKEAVKE